MSTPRNSAGVLVDLGADSTELPQNVATSHPTNNPEVPSHVLPSSERVSQRAFTPSLEQDRVHTPFLDRGDTPTRQMLLPGMATPTHNDGIDSLNIPDTGSGVGFKPEGYDNSDRDEDSTRPFTQPPKGKKLRRDGYDYAIAGDTSPPRPRSRIKILLLVSIGLIVVAAAVIIPVYFTIIKPKSHPDASNNGTDNNGGGPSSSSGIPNSAIDFTPQTNGDGSTIFDPLTGKSFNYTNSFGGSYFFDPSNPFPSSLGASSKKKRDASPFNGYTGPSAQAQSFTPPLNTSWKWGTDQVRGVNLGGWLVLEPFITPDLFQKYLDKGAEDEWTLTEAMRADTSNGGGLNLLVDHYETFIVRFSFLLIAYMLITQ